MPTKKPSIIGLDIGYGYTKATAGKATITLPSVIGHPVSLRYEGSTLTNGANLSSIQNINLAYGSTRLFVGDLAIQQSQVKWSPGYRDRTKSNIMKTLFMAAVSELNIQGDCYIVTGLPVNWFEDEDQNALKEQLLGSHQFRRGGDRRISVNVLDVDIKPQPFGTFYSQALATAKGKTKVQNRAMTTGTIAILDIGCHTTDLALIQEMQYHNNLSGSIEHGTSNLHRIIAEAINNRYRTNINIHQASQAVEKETITIRGKKIKLGPLLDPLYEIAARPIRDFALSLWNDAATIDTILATGGGSAILAPYLMDTYPHLHIVDQPALANVHGFYNLGALRWNS